MTALAVCASVARRGSSWAQSAAARLVLASGILAGCINSSARPPSCPDCTDGVRATSSADSLPPPAALARELRRLGFLPLALLLPDASSWSTSRDEPQRYEARHLPSASRIVAETIDGTFGTADQCMHGTRIAELDPEARIDTGRVRAPLALEVAFETFVHEQRDGLVVGTIAAVTSVGGRCHRVRLETRARGRDAAGELGARLAFFRDVSLPSLLVVRDGHAAAPGRTSLERR